MACAPLRCAPLGWPLARCIPERCPLGCEYSELSLEMVMCFMYLILFANLKPLLHEQEDRLEQITAVQLFLTLLLVREHASMRARECANARINTRSP